MRKHFLLVAAAFGIVAAFSAPRVLAADMVPEKTEKTAPKEIALEMSVDMLASYANQPQSMASPATMYVVGGDAKSSSLARVSEMLENQFGQSQLSATVKEKKIEGDTATVTAQVTLRNPKTGVSLRQLETLTMHRKLVQLSVEERKGFEHDACWVWQVQLDEALLARWDEDDIGVLARLAAYIGLSGEVEKKNAAWISQVNIKQLSLGMLQLTQDYGEVFAFTNDNFKEKLMPYIRAESIFSAPGGAPNSVGYMINVQLINANLAAISQPAQTVGIYESKDGALVFRYDGKAAVGFADGHVKLVSREEAKTLRWKP